MTRAITIVPPIKCQGIKTKLVPWIRSIMPANFQGRWIEPFMGSGVVAFNLQAKRVILADSNPHIIRFYEAIKRGEITSRIARSFLVNEGAILKRTDGQYFYDVRNRFNVRGNPLDFLFLNRACFNGMIRFNRKGNFNVPFCNKPNRFSPAYITKICNQIQSIANALSMGDYEFIRQDFLETVQMAKSGDMLYCDPPYIGRHTDYYNGWNEDNERNLNSALASTRSRFILSTWHSNDFRKNENLSTIWARYPYLTREHFYHLGAKEKNRNPMLEALVTNYVATYKKPVTIEAEQMKLMEKRASFGLRL
ncbi:MAG: Dam family site-specific DNA-(adenine-N6)-methyltransferase [Gammaproteobacteria bacterium]|nr:Dam family site-specific DNA-(adenine-N6)-methyltransferase [Gammaproteobacteria bacterium]